MAFGESELVSHGVQPQHLAAQLTALVSPYLTDPPPCGFAASQALGQAQPVWVSA